MITKKVLIEVNVLPNKGHSVRLFCEPNQIGELIELFAEKDYFVTTSTITIYDPLLLSCVTLVTVDEVKEKMREVEAAQQEEDRHLFSSGEKW